MVLPIVIPPTETYQSTSLVLGVILSTPNISNEYFNNYMMLSCKKTDIMSEMWLDFYGTDWESFRKRGIFEMNLFQFMNFDRKGFLGFIKERIDQGCYILFYCIDEYYLSYSDYYHKKHYIHDVYVYGYEGTSSFWVLAYKMKKLMLFQVNAEEICEVLGRDPGSFLKTIFEDLEKLVVTGKLKNKKEAIENFIKQSY